jgi:transposase
VRQSLFANFSAIVEIGIDQQLEQRINIKFLVKLSKSGPEICQMLQQAYGEDILKRSTVSKWVQRYYKGGKYPMDNKRSGRPSTSRSDENINRVNSLVLTDRQMTVQVIADELQIGKTSVYSILTDDLEMRKICGKIVPTLLIPEQKLQRKQCCIDWKALKERDVFLERIITGIWGTWQQLQLNRQRCSEA